MMSIVRVDSRDMKKDCVQCVSLGLHIYAFLSLWLTICWHHHFLVCSAGGVFSFLGLLLQTAFVTNSNSWFLIAVVIVWLRAFTSFHCLSLWAYINTRDYFRCIKCKLYVTQSFFVKGCLEIFADVSNVKRSQGPMENYLLISSTAASVAEAFVAAEAEEAGRDAMPADEKS